MIRPLLCVTLLSLLIIPAFAASAAPSADAWKCVSVDPKSFPPVAVYDCPAPWDASTETSSTRTPLRP